MPLCLGTDEFSIKCIICKKCFMKYECSKIEPKILKNKRKQYYSKQMRKTNELGNL